MSNLIIEPEFKVSDIDDQYDSIMIALSVDDDAIRLKQDGDVVCISFDMWEKLKECGDVVLGAYKSREKEGEA